MIVGEISEFDTFSTMVNSQYSILLILLLFLCYPTFGTTAYLVALLCAWHTAPRFKSLLRHLFRTFDFSVWLCFAALLSKVYHVCDYQNAQ